VTLAKPCLEDDHVQPQMSCVQSTSRPFASEITRLLSVPRWYAAYTLPRHEKAVVEQLRLRTIETYLPLFEKMSQWKDRVVWVQLPLFPSYVFVRMPLRDRAQVLSLSSVLRLVGFNGHPTPLPEGEIESLRTYLSVRRAEPFPYLNKGNRVRVVSGPLRNVEGVIVRRKGKMRIIVAIDSIQRSVAVELEAADLRSLA
jgi:transcription antitermination factor NusG